MYAYDRLNRITQDHKTFFGAAGLVEYQYDAGGNRTLWKQIISYAQTYAATSNRQTQYGASTLLLHDNAGNLTAYGSKVFSYDSANRMSMAVNGSTTATYRYNGLGQRTTKLATTGGNTVVTHYDYDKDGKYLGQIQLNADGTYAWGDEYIWLDDMPIAQVHTVYGVSNAVASQQLTYIHADQLNTPRAMTDSTQKVVWKWESEAYGRNAPNNDPDGDGIQNHLDLRFPGQIADAETGLFYNNARYYDPVTGRYTQSDPVGLEGGLNTYSYAENDPVRNVDPLGLWVKRCTRQLGNKDKPATSRFNPLRHEYLNVSGTILSFQAGDSMLWGQGRLDNNEDQSKGCTMLCNDDKFDAYVIKAAQEIGAPTYCVAAYPGTTMHILGARNCQTWVSDVLKKAREEYQKNEKCPQCK